MLLCHKLSVFMPFHEHCDTACILAAPHVINVIPYEHHISLLHAPLCKKKQVQRNKQQAQVNIDELSLCADHAVVGLTRAGQEDIDELSLYGINQADVGLKRA